MRQAAQVEPYNPPALYSIRQGTVMGIHPFGAFVRLDGEEKDALVHVTQLKVGREGAGWAGRGRTSASAHVFLWRELHSASAMRTRRVLRRRSTSPPPCTRHACAGGALFR